MRSFLLVVSLPLVAALLNGCGPTCGGEATRIASLASGERLAIDGACVVTEAVTVPAGAIVEGGTFRPSDAAPLLVTPSSDPAYPTTLRGARIEGGASLGAIRVEGAGSARIESTILALARGSGIAARNGAEVVVVGTQLTGNVDPLHLLELPSPTPPDRFALYGIVAVAGATVRVGPGSPTTVTRFASAGLGCGNATLSASDLVLTENHAVGVLAVGCTVDLERVEVTRTLVSAGVPGMGIALSESDLTGRTLSLHDAPGYGLFARGGTVELTGVTVSGLAQAGLWAESGSLRVSGGMLVENAGTAIGAVDAVELAVTDTMIAGTHLAPIPTRGGFGVERVGDGLHVAAAASTPLALTLERVDLRGSERVGLVIDGGGGSLAPVITSLVVDAPGVTLGAVAQNVSGLPAGWDADITRVTSAARDATASVLEVSDGTPYGILMPPT